MEGIHGVTAERIAAASNGTETSFMALEDDFIFKPDAATTLRRLGELSPRHNSSLLPRSTSLTDTDRWLPRPPHFNYM